MARTKSTLNLLNLTFVLSLGLVTAPGLSSQVLAQGPTLISQKDSKADWNAFDPPNDGAPGRRIGGGTRGICPEEANKIAGLVPTTNVGRTLSEHPTLFFYVPAIPENPDLDIKIVFELVDGSDPANEKEIYKTTVPMPQSAGAIGIRVPDGGNVPPLEKEKFYNWYLSIICTQKAESSNSDIKEIGGWIQRIAPSLTLDRALARTSMRARLRFYEKERLWYDYLATLAELRTKNPNDSILKAKWKQVLESVELGDLAKEPLIQVSAEQ